MKHLNFFLVLIGILFTVDLNAQQNTSWETLKTETKPSARHECAFVECDGKFYLIGGRRINTVDVFDPKTDSWEKKKKTPLEFHHFQPVVYKHKIYLVGVMSGQYPNEKPVPNIWIYHPQEDKWEKGIEIPEARRRGSSGIVVRKNKIYMVCGIIDGHNGDFVSWFDEYDLKTNQWKQLPDAPRPRDHFAATVVDNKLFAASGRTTSKRTKKVFELTVPQVDYFDFKTKKWSTLPNNLPTLRAGASTVAYKRKLIVIGGESGTQKIAHNEVDVYDTKTNQWKTWKNLNRGRHGTQAFIYKSAIYTVAGCGNRGGSPELNTVERLKLK